MPPSRNNDQITANTRVTIGLVFTILAVSGGAIWKAAQVLTEFEYVKSGLVELRTDVSDIKRIIQRIDRDQRSETSRQ